MSEATVKAHTDAIYAAFQESGALLYELDKEQIYKAARLAAQTIESTGTTKAIVRAWLEKHALIPLPPGYAVQWARAISEVMGSGITYTSDRARQLAEKIDQPEDHR